MLHSLKIRSLLTLVLISLPLFLYAQTETEMKLPYQEIPEAAENYTAGSVASRMIDGLGFRYYWATEGLREEDLNYRPTEEARSSRETLEHIFGLSRTILNASLKKANEGRVDVSSFSFKELRKVTLENFHQASLLIKESDDLSEHEIIYKRGEKESIYPYWYLINGPIADAIWHTGQIVSFRRSSGNPFNSQVSLFQGKLR